LKADCVGANLFLWRNSGIFQLKGQGNLTMKSNSTVGTSLLTLAGVVQGTAWKKISIGDIYTDAIVCSDNLTNTTAGDSISLVSSGAITVNNPIVNNTTGKPVIILAAQGAAATGTLTTATAATLTTDNGLILLRSGVSADGTIVSTGAAHILAGGATSMGATGAQAIDWRASGNLTLSGAVNTAVTAGKSITMLAAQGVAGALSVTANATTSGGAINLYSGVKADGITNTGFAGNYNIASTSSILSNGGNIAVQTGNNTSILAATRSVISGALNSGSGNINVYAGCMSDLGISMNNSSKSLNQTYNLHIH